VCEDRQGRASPPQVRMASLISRFRTAPPRARGSIESRTAEHGGMASAGAACRMPPTESDTAMQAGNTSLQHPSVARPTQALRQDVSAATRSEPEDARSSSCCSHGQVNQRENDAPTRGRSTMVVHTTSILRTHPPRLRQPVVQPKSVVCEPADIQQPTSPATDSSALESWTGSPARSLQVPCANTDKQVPMDPRAALQTSTRPTRPQSCFRSQACMSHVDPAQPVNACSSPIPAVVPKLISRSNCCACSSPIPALVPKCDLDQGPMKWGPVSMAVGHSDASGDVQYEQLQGRHLRLTDVGDVSEAMQRTDAGELEADSVAQLLTRCRQVLRSSAPPALVNRSHPTLPVQPRQSECGSSLPHTTSSVSSENITCLHAASYTRISFNLSFSAGRPEKSGGIGCRGCCNLQLPHPTLQCLPHLSLPRSSRVTYSRNGGRRGGTFSPALHLPLPVSRTCRLPWPSHLPAAHLTPLQT
jgi:hypothetical protein